MIGAAVAVLAATGTFYLFTAVALGWTGLAPTPRLLPTHHGARRSLRLWLDQAGLGGVDAPQFVGAVVAVGIAGCAVGALAFGGPLPALALGAAAAAAPVASFRRRRHHRRDAAREAWPRLVDEIRLLTGSVGRSIPQAIFEAGAHTGDELSGAFAESHHVWSVTTDLGRALDVLKEQLADPGVDATCETLLVAHELGGADLDRRLAALAEDRRVDAAHRKDARAKQSGARFARRFVLLVPVGMALAGMSVGNGRDAYQSPTGQAVVAVAVALVAACWVWAGRIMRLPDEQRVLS